MPPNAYPPYSYAPVPQPTPQRHWPIPAARHVPLIWTITLTAVTAVAVVLVALSPYVITAAPAPGSATLYANSLAANDSAWGLQQGQCAYANGGLDAIAGTYTASEVDTSLGIAGRYDPTALCTLQGQNPADLRLSVRILPQANLNNALQPVIFVHTDVAVLFTTTGEFATLFHDTNLNQWVVLYQAPTNQWHTADMLSNTVVVQVRSDNYTVALNGAQIYQGTFGDNASFFPANGAIALGAFTTGSGDVGEAAYADLLLTTP